VNNFGYRTYGVTDEEADNLRGMGWEWSQRLLRFMSPTYRSVYPVASNKQVLWATGPWAGVSMQPVLLYPTALAAAAVQVIGD
jgi:hypothetical protein